MDTRIHPITGALLTRNTRPHTITVGARTETIELPGWYPEGDGDSIHTGSDLAAWDATVARLRATDGQP